MRKSSHYTAQGSVQLALLPFCRYRGCPRSKSMFLITIQIYTTIKRHTFFIDQHSFFIDQYKKALFSYLGSKTANMNKVKAVVGIDPGAHTGIAVKIFPADGPANGQWVDVDSMSLWQAFDYCRELSQQYECIFIFEDARKRDWYGQGEQMLYRKFSGGMHMTAQERNMYKGMLLGAGDIRGACRNWEEFLRGNSFKFVMQPPKKGATKVDAPFFKRLTGWAGRTNEHSRDAGMIIQGITRNGLAALVK